MKDYLQRYKMYFDGQGFEAKSWDEYERNITQFLNWLETRNTSLEKATDFTLIEYGNYLSKLTPHFHPERKLKPNTILQRKACIRAFFTYLVKVEGFKSNPSEVAFSNLHQDKTFPDFLTPEEIHLVLKVPSTLERAVFQILLSTGMRIGELLSCDLNSVSLELGEITVRGKGGDERRVLLDSQCSSVIREYLKIRGSKPGPLFVVNGEGMTYNQVYYVFGQVREKTGIWRLHPHLLRHTFATYMLSKGATIKEVQEQLGHKRLETTSKYTHPTKEMKERHDVIMADLKKEKSIKNE